MNRMSYFDYIEDKLITLAFRTTQRGKLNLLELHIHSEDFYRHLLNCVYQWNVVNLNSSLQNVEAIDLIDIENKIILQVSATSTKVKIESALSKNSLTNYDGYRFKFISIAKDSADLKIKTFKNPHGINFDPAKDIIDINQLLADIKGLHIDLQKETYLLVKSELGSQEIGPQSDSNLAAIINILAKENLKIYEENENKNSFKIERKIEFNSLSISSKAVIEDYAIYHSRLGKMYDEIDKMGSNKSLSVIQLVRTQYLTEIRQDKEIDSDTIFHNIIERVREIIERSINYESIPLDELSMCIQILVVDTFIRCRIFANPTENKNVTTR
ncbi:ABC-three component system protein [Dyadobacter sp. CY326]|uniref:ABC-three component system protein n=1 Tax=Dyadobacter sp. CY326 TaxID=2907300 RepID=UPI00286EA66E|nr:ABC-three component system protein [Dyadobacter sp. CY326]